jgi:hypothetical protein
MSWQTFARCLESDSEVKTDESKSVPASCGLGPRRTWNTAWKSLCKFVCPELFQRENAIKKKEKRKEYVWPRTSEAGGAVALGRRSLKTEMLVPKKHFYCSFIIN